MAHYKGPAKELQRAQHLNKKREREQEDAEFKKIGIIDQQKAYKISKSFCKDEISIENNLQNSTSGLLTVSEMKIKQENARKEREKLMAHKVSEKKKALRSKEKDKSKTKLKQQQQIKSLSFCIDDNYEEQDSEANKVERRRYGKDPHVDTCFLPDIDRDKKENEIRQMLADEWNSKQQQIKEETFEVTYSYWDGVGHRRSVVMKKGDTIYKFLLKCLENLRREFPELKTVSADQLVYVKEDIIIPQTNTFYDFIITKARGKSGPLFNYDVLEDTRLVHDASIEKQDSHAGKIVQRSWYDRNKHIFPASRWEPFDPLKTYESYSTHDR